MEKDAWVKERKRKEKKNKQTKGESKGKNEENEVEIKRKEKVESYPTDFKKIIVWNYPTCLTKNFS